MSKIEHLGIAVKDLETSSVLYAKLLNTLPYKEEIVESEQVSTMFFKTGETKIELLQALDPNSAIAKFIEKRGEGIHHIAFEVDDIYKEMIRLKEEGFVLLSDTPKRGADNKLIVFLHPKSSGGVLVELCQEIKESE
jgi:methylmalonyl-CoA/ethylmalonyl-CoA epimerase